MKHNFSRTNPYKEIAALHNKGIAFVFRRLKLRQSEDCKVNFETILEVVSEYMAKVQGDETELNMAKNYVLLANFFNGRQDDLINQMLILQNVPREVINFLNEIRYLNDDMNSEELLSKISDIEQKLLNSDFSNDQIKYVLLFIAVAKGSIKDWKVNSDLILPGKILNGGWPWKEDAEAALEAFLIAPIDIAVSGGGLTVVSVIGGSVVSSTWAAIKNFKI